MKKLTTLFALLLAAVAGSAQADDGDTAAGAIAKMADWIEVIQDYQGLVADASSYLSAHKEQSEGSYAALLDKNVSTFFHSAWSGSAASQSGHELQAKLPEAVNSLYIYFVSRNTGTGIPQAFRIDGSNNASDFTDNLNATTTWTEGVGSETGGPSAASEAYLSAKITLSDSYKYLRFVPTSVASTTGNWFCLAEFWLLPSNETTDAAINLLNTITSADDLNDDLIAEINEIDAALRNPFSKVNKLIAQAEAVYAELKAGAETIAVGYPTTEALAAYRETIDNAKAAIEAGGDAAAAEATATALETATTTVKSAASTNYIPRTDIYYTINSARGSMVYDPNQSSKTDTDGNQYLWYTTSVDDTNVNHLWGFIEKDGSYYMYNVGKKQFAGVSTVGPVSGYQFSGGSWMFSDTPSSITLDAGTDNWVATPNVRVQATSAVTGNTYAMSISTSYTGPVITYDAKNDGGVPMTFAVSSVEIDPEVTAAIEALLEDITPYAEALQEVINQADAINFGTELNQYVANDDFDAVLNAAKAEIDKVEAKETTKDALTQARETLEQAIAALELNMPKNGQFLRIKSVLGANAYLKAAGASTRMTFSTTADKSTIFCYYENKLVAYENGLAVNAVREIGEAGGSVSNFTFVKGLNGSIATYSLYDTNFSNNYLWSTGADASNADRATGNRTDWNDNFTFTLEEVLELPVKLNAGGDGKCYATFSSPVDISNVDGATTYKIVNTTENKAKYDELGVTGIPANTGVLLMTDGNEETTATVTIGDYTGEAVETGLSAIIAAETTLDSTKKVLGMSNDKVGFYTHSGTSTGGFKAYLPVSNGNSKGLALEAADETDGISLTQTANAEGTAVYNLQGQRVEKAQRGVYIQNGRKVVVK